MTSDPKQIRVRVRAQKLLPCSAQVFLEGGLIKKSAIVVFLLLMFFYGLQVGNVVALERTFEVTSCGSRYEVYIEASDTWQVGTQLEVKTRLTLIQKQVGDSQVEYVTNAYSKSLNVGVSESLAVFYFGDRARAHLENPFSTSKDYRALVNLTKDGDYWETQILLEMNEDDEGKLERGEIIDAVLVVAFTLDAFGANHTKLDESFVGTWSLSDDDQILVTVFRPSFSVTEIITAVGGCGIIVLGLVMFVMERVGWVSFGFLNAFSKFANKYPLLVHVVSTFFLVVLGVAFIPVLISLSIMFSEFLLIALIFQGIFIVSSIVLAVGLLEFLLRDWKFLTISVGFLVALFVTYLIYIALDFLVPGPLG